MDKLLIEGGHSLRGKVKISGSKNASLPILISALLANGESTFYNVPKLDDVTNTLSLLNSLGASVKCEKDVVKINSSGLNNYEPPYELVHKMRASILVLGPLIARLNKARLSLPGGCLIGSRPINFHLKALAQLGVKIELENGYVNAFTKGLVGNSIYFDFPTVTGTENLMMASVFADGVTVLKNAACEPEIVALSNVLNSMGAKIEGAGTFEITITGVKELLSVSNFIMPDRIETGTFMIAAALTKGDITINNCLPEDLSSVISKLRFSGAVVDIVENCIRVQGSDEILGVDFKTLPYPGFPTDMQAPFMTLMSVSSGLSMVFETIFENRFIHSKELNRMGADIRIIGNIAIIKGVASLSAAKVKASDLRASASLVLAGLVASGTTEISGIDHLDRGYENIEKKIKNLGGVIKRISV